MCWRLLTIFLVFSVSFLVFTLNCDCRKNRKKYKFYLLKPCQRSLWEKLHIENVKSLESCIELANSYKGLALNYSPKERFTNNYGDFSENNTKLMRDHYWLQPQLYFNCHILRCPENSTFGTLINDTAFDYYSLYENPIDSSDYKCLPEVGLFVLQTDPQNFENSSLMCSNSSSHCSALAHIATTKRTAALTQLIQDYNHHQMTQKFKSNIHLAYVGLHFNRSRSHNFDFFNLEMENLKCFPYRAWEPGNPKRSSQFVNTSCVALTTRGTWKTVSCHRKLPYICEIFTSCEEKMELK